MSLLTVMKYHQPWDDCGAGGESSGLAGTPVMTYIINTRDPTAIDHMVTLLKLKIDPIDCKQIIYFSHLYLKDFFSSRKFQLGIFILHYIIP